MHILLVEFLISITIVSAKKSFLELKLVKYYVRSTTSSEKLKELDILLIEKKLLKEIDHKMSLFIILHFKKP